MAVSVAARPLPWAVCVEERWGGPDRDSFGALLRPYGSRDRIRAGRPVVVEALTVGSMGASNRACFAVAASVVRGEQRLWRDSHQPWATLGGQCSRWVLVDEINDVGTTTRQPL